MSGHFGRKYPVEISYPAWFARTVTSGPQSGPRLSMLDEDDRFL